VALGNFAARACLRRADGFAIRGSGGADLACASLHEALERLQVEGCNRGERLVRAALWRFAQQLPEIERLAPGDPRLGLEISYESDVPFQVGLSGSSAIVIAVLRGLARWFDCDIPAYRLAQLALDAEVVDLGIAAGPMDRMIQSYEGVVCMDFAEPRSERGLRRVDPSLLPPLFVAWDERIGEMSGVVHADVRRRFEAGEPAVLAAMRRLPVLVEEGVRCLEARDVKGFQRCVDENFDTRASIWNLRDRDRELVSVGRGCGAAVKFCGSGGSVVGVMREAEEYPAIEAAYRAAGISVACAAIAHTGRGSA
jgi:glucuronokinase